MKRLTSERCSGIKQGYWSPAKKDELIQRLGKYEDTGLEPEEIGYPLSVSCAASSPKGEPRDGGTAGRPSVGGAFGTWRSPDEPPEKFAPVIICREDKEGNRRVEAGSLQEDGWYKIYGTRTKKILGWMPMPEAMKDA